MAAQVSLAPSASCSSLLDVLDTISLDDDHDVEAEQNILAGPTTPTPTPTPSSPAGAASRTGKDEDVLDAAEGRSSGDVGGGGLIHLAALAPLPALLREWSHGPAAAAAAEKQSSAPSPPRAQRTSSGTPIAVAVQNDREEDNNARSDDDLDGTIPPPPPPPPLCRDSTNSSHHPQASPLWSMLQSSVTAATATATSGTAATTNAAAVLPAAALDSPPVKVSLIVPVYYIDAKCTRLAQHVLYLSFVLLHRGTCACVRCAITHPSSCTVCLLVFEFINEFANTK